MYTIFDTLPHPDRQEVTSVPRVLLRNKLSITSAFMSCSMTERIDFTWRHCFAILPRMSCGNRERALEEKQSKVTCSAHHSNVSVSYFQLGT